jgi:hypothetical protein
VGALTLLGPLAQDVICTMTALCNVYLTGTGLHVTNNLRILNSNDTCSSAAALPSGYGNGFRRRYGAEMVFLDDVAGTIYFGVCDSCTDYSFGYPTEGLSSPDFILCWAFDANPTFQVGSFQISGPFTRATACTLTMSCTLQIAGVGLASSNVLRIIKASDACGALLAPEVSTFAGLSATTSSTTVAGTAQTFDVAPNESTGGTMGAIYRVCWAHQPSQNIHYAFHVGDFALHGPLQQNVDCKMTKRCTLQLTGLGFVSTNNVRVVSSAVSCGSTAAMPSGYTGATFNVSVVDVGGDLAPGGLTEIFNFFTATAGTGRLFKLCWAFFNSTSFHVGDFKISGPATGAFACTLSLACTVQLGGLNLRDSAVRVLPQGTACGADVGGVTTFAGLAVTTSVTSSGSHDHVFPLGTEVTGGTSGASYKLCWSYAPVLNTDFSYEVGAFTLNGPVTEDFFCSLTISCAVQLDGVGFATTNRVKVQASGVVCDAAATAATFAGASFDVAVTPQGVASDFSIVGPNVSGAQQTSRFVIGTATAGDPGDFALCWGHAGNSVFKVGTFRIAGPFTRDVECTLTESCALELTGLDLASTNVVRILPSSSACGNNVSGVSTFVGNVTGLSTFAGLNSTLSAAAALPHTTYTLATELTGGTAGALYTVCFAYAPAAAADFSLHRRFHPQRRPHAEFRLPDDAALRREPRRNGAREYQHGAGGCERHCLQLGGRATH